MLKEIKYGGFTANPNDHDSVEGDLAVAMNLVPENGTVKPVLPPSVKFTLPTGMRLLAIHDTSSFDGKHYILQEETGNKALFWWNGNENDNVEQIISVFTTVSHLEPVGNTLVTLAEEGIGYFLWKDDKYIVLGSRMPEITLSFGLYKGPSIDSDPVHTNNNWDDYNGNDGRDNFSNEDKVDYNNKLHGAIAKLINEKVTSEGGFCMPFFIRYAYQLFDESITMHSAPVLMIPDGLHAYTLSNMSNEIVDVGVYTSKSRIMYEANIDGDVNLWKDIIKGISIYISAPLWTYDASKNMDKVFGGYYTTKSVYTQKVNGIYTSFSVHSNADADDNDVAIPQFEKARVIDNISNCAQFYLVDTIKIEDLPTSREFLEIPGYVLQTLVNREVMTDDFNSHFATNAKVAFSYNGRLNVANISQIVFEGYDPFGDFIYSETGAVSPGPPAEIKVVVEIVKDGKTFVVEKSSFKDWPLNHGGACWFFYPDPNATNAWLYINDNCYHFPLKQHETLNGAYFFDFNGPLDFTGTPPLLTNDNIIRSPNKLYTSEVNNPFLFTSDGTNTVGTGNIKGICAAVRPVSTGQMGYADLYIFADDGLWVAKINEKGTYTNVTLATGDICINPNSITQMETTVLFATARGIMLISGSQTQCISEAINDGDVPPENGMQTVMGAFTQLGRSYPTIAPFRDFLGNEDASLRMLYDYRHQRIIVYNPDYSYAYIYSLESHKWGMMESDIQYTINSYPDALAVTGDNVLVNYSDSPVGDGSAIVIPALLVTRPLTLDMPDILKTVRRVLQRGMFRRWQGGEHMTALLYGSRDLYDWHLIYASNGERMQGFSGTPYKWFRVSLVLNVEGNESITGATIELIDKYTGKPR